MSQLRVKVDIDPLLGSLKRLGVHLAEKAITRSLNRSIRGVNTDAIRAVRSELTLKAKDIRRDMRIRRAVPRTLEAALVVEVKGTGLIKFKARDTTRGVTVKVKKRGGRKRLPGAFIARAKTSGSRQVFTRERGAGRTPIKKLFSTAVGQYLDDDDVLDPIGRGAFRRFEKELSAQVDFLLR